MDAPNQIPWSHYVNMPVGESASSAILTDPPAKELTMEDALLNKAKRYQEYMHKISIPSQRGSLVPCTSWRGLGMSLKKLYGQPLHYLTNIKLKEMDQIRSGSEDEDIPLDCVIHPCKAEITIWLMEEIHRSTASPLHLAKLWLNHPNPHAFIDPIFP